MKNLTRKVLIILSLLMMLCAIGFAQPGSIIDEHKNLIITKQLQVENSGKIEKIIFRRVACADTTQDLETINIISSVFPGPEAQPIVLKLMVNDESFTLEPCKTIYSVAEANNTPVPGYCFVVPKDVQGLILNHRESVSLRYGVEGNMLACVPSSEDKQDLGFTHIWTRKNAGIK